MKANFGLMPELDAAAVRDKRQRHAAYAGRAPGREALCRP